LHTVIFLPVVQASTSPEGDIEKKLWQQKASIRAKTILIRPHSYSP
jgi:hypothetical protein